MYYIRNTMGEQTSKVPATLERMVVKTYRIHKTEFESAEAAAKKIHKKELSKLIREYVQKLAKKHTP